jgi:hypothetical protein
MNPGAQSAGVSLKPVTVVAHGLLSSRWVRTVKVELDVCLARDNKEAQVSSIYGGSRTSPAWVKTADETLASLGRYCSRNFEAAV